MSVLDDWIHGEHTAAAVTHPTYRKGTGPGVIVIHEIPGITPEVVGFAEEVVGLAARWCSRTCSGAGGADVDSPMVAMVAASGLREPGVHQARDLETSPIADWLR